jgi:hypothetical protein
VAARIARAGLALADVGGAGLIPMVFSLWTRPLAMLELVELTRGNKRLKRAVCSFMDALDGRAL